MADITVPVLGESVTEATVGSWLKAAGENVAKDEVLVELETDKVSVEVSAVEDGVLSEIVASEGDTVEIGALLGRIGGGNGAAASVAPAETPAAAPAATGGGESLKVVVPAMGESVTEGTLSQWLKNPGDAVEQDEPIAEIETDKVAIEVPAPAAGVLAQTLVEPGSTVGIGAEIAVLTAGAVATAVPSAPASAAAATTSASSAAVAPSVRRIGAENNVNPADIPGTGRGGRATKGDALNFISQGGASTPAPVQQARPVRDIGPREERVKMTRLRQTIARRLKEAQNTAAMLTTFNDVDLTAVMALRKKYKDQFLDRHGVKLGFMSFFTKAAVTALQEIPAVNAEIDGTDIIYKNFYDISMAVGTDKGLVTPVVRDADMMSLAEIEAEIGRLGKLARDGKLSLDDLQGGTFTITNGGVYGSMMSTPILNPPQSGVLGMHRIEQRPVAINGEVKIRPMMYLALSYDHRIVDGKEAVTFLVRIKECLEDPERMLLNL